MRLWRSRRRREADAMLEHWQRLGKRAAEAMKAQQEAFDALFHSAPTDDPATTSPDLREPDSGGTSWEGHSAPSEPF